MFDEYSIRYPAIEIPAATLGAVQFNVTDCTPAVAMRFVGDPAVARGVAVIKTGPATADPPAKIGVMRNVMSVPFVNPVALTVRVSEFSVAIVV